MSGQHSKDKNPADRAAGSAERLPGKLYRAELLRLQGELVKLQETGR